MKTIQQLRAKMEYYLTRKCSIYTITNTVTQEQYIGQSVEPTFRWLHHRQDLRAGRHHNKKMQEAFNTYGEGAFVFEILEQVDTDTGYRREKELIHQLAPDYNIGPVHLKRKH